MSLPRRNVLLDESLLDAALSPSVKMQALDALAEIKRLTMRLELSIDLSIYLSIYTIKKWDIEYIYIYPLIFESCIPVYMCYITLRSIFICVTNNWDTIYIYKCVSASLCIYIYIQDNSGIDMGK